MTLDQLQGESNMTQRQPRRHRINLKSTTKVSKKQITDYNRGIEPTNQNQDTINIHWRASSRGALRLVSVTRCLARWAEQKLQNPSKSLSSKYLKYREPIDYQNPKMASL
mgnify:CR=1 FL=1